jgi:hypothetical protein
MDVQVAPIALSLTRRLDGIVKGTFYFNRPECDANNLSGCGALLSVKVRGNTRLGGAGALGATGSASVYSRG